MRVSAPGRAPARRAAQTAGQGVALEQVTRAMALALGVGTAVFGLLALGAFAAQQDSFSPLWTWTFAFGIFVPPLAAGLLSYALPVRVLRGLLALSAASQLVGLLLLVPAITTAGGTVPPEQGSPWMLSISAVGTSAAAVAWRPVVAWIYLAASVVALGVDRAMASSESLAEIALQDAVYTLLFDAIFAALAIATARAGRTLDAVADQAVRETRVASATEAAARERFRIEGLIHDSVLVALLASARGARQADDEARRAITRLREAEEPPSTDAIAVEEWVWRLQALTTDLAPAARFSHEHDGRNEPIPSEVATAMLEACAEALRNSVRHAAAASRAVHARVTTRAVEVSVLDDGPGFDVAAVNPARLGLAVSILDRMRSLSGGDAVVVSRPGLGTRVALTWRAA